MVKRGIFTLVIIIIFLFTFVFANDILKENKLGDLQIKSLGYEWVVLHSTDSDFNINILDEKSKSTEICMIAKDDKTKLTNLKSVYDFKGEKLNDAEIKTKVDLKDNKSKDAYCYTTSNENYIRFGENSTILSYQDIKKLNYNIGWAEVNFILYKNISNKWENSVNDLWTISSSDKLKFGANDFSNTNIEQYKLIIISKYKINDELLQPYLQNEAGERHQIFLSDICNRGWQPYLDLNNFTIYNITSQCIKTYSFNNITNTTVIEVTFYSDYFIDPEIVYSLISSVNKGAFYFNSTRQSDADGTLSLNGTLNGTFISASLIDTLTNAYLQNISYVVTQGANPNKDLMGYWRFEEGTGTTTQDDSNYNNDGTLTDGAFYNSSSHNGLYSAGFDGVNDGITILDSPSLDLDNGTSFTISFWEKTVSTGCTFFMLKHNSADNFRGYWIGMNINGGGSGLIDLGLINTLNANGIEITGNISINTNNWFHVVVAYNGTSKASGVRLYVNGVQDTNVIVRDDNLYNTIVNIRNLEIGLRSPTTCPLRGSIDEVMILNRSLSTSEVNNLYNLTKNNFIKNSNYTNATFYIRSALSDVNNNNTPLYNNLGGQTAFWHFNNVSTKINGNTTMVVDWLGNYNGTMEKGFNCGNVTGKIDTGCLLNNTAIVNISYSDLGLTQMLWKRNTTDTAWKFIANASGQLYENGYVTSNSSFQMPLSNDTGRIIIGKFSNSLFFNGSIDEVRIFNRTLLQPEIMELMINGSMRYGNRFKINGTSSQSTNAGRFHLVETFSESSNLLWSDYYYNYTFGYDENTAPTISVNYPLNQTNISKNFIMLNVSVIDLDNNPLTIYFYNETGIINWTTSTTGNNVTFNWTKLQDGNHIWYANVSDGYINISTGIMNFTTDTTPPNLFVHSPQEGNVFLIYNVLYNITINDTGVGIFGRFYSLDGATNVSFDGDEYVNNQPASYKVNFCVNDTLNNLRCSGDINFSVVAKVGETGFTIGEPIKLAKIKLDYEKEWLINISNYIIINILDLNNNLIDVDEVKIIYNESLPITKKNLTRISLGVYKQEFVIQDEIKNLSFNAYAREKGKVIEEEFYINLRLASKFEQYKENLKNSIALGIKRIENLVADYWYIVVGFGALVILFVFSYIMLKNFRIHKTYK